MESLQAVPAKHSKVMRQERWRTILPDRTAVYEPQIGGTEDGERGCREGKRRNAKTLRWGPQAKGI